MAKSIRGRNEGSVSQRPNGTWRAQISINGKRIGASYKTKSEALKWILSEQLKLDRGFDFQGSKTTLEIYLPQWLENSKTALRAKTAYQYGRVMANHILPHIGKIPLKDLRLDKVEKFYSELIQSGVGIRTVRLCHNILHKALEKAMHYGLVVFNPAHGATLPQYRHGEMQVLDQVQVSQFLVAAEGSGYKALFYVAVTTGMRQGELFGLKWADIQWSSGVIHLQRQVQRVTGQSWSFVEPKTKSGWRTITLGERTLQVIREHKVLQQQAKITAGERWHENDLVFPSSVGTPRDPSNLRIEFNKVLTKAGLQKIRFHDLRHTAASLLLNHRVPVIVVSRMLGHSKPSVTLDIYGHLYNEMQDEAAALMDKLVTPIPVKIPNESKSEKGK